MNRKIEKNLFVPEYWDNAYQSNNIGWDIGSPTPIFNKWAQTINKRLSICVIGAGNGWDAINLAKKGHNVTAVDFANTAIINMYNESKKQGVKLKLVNSDIFNLDNTFNSKFDIVLEYTCYCAINPLQRVDYVNLVERILKPNGKLVALFFPLDNDENRVVPPYSVNVTSIIKIFSKKFNVIKKEFSDLSIEPRKNREIFMILCKNK